MLDLAASVAGRAHLDIGRVERSLASAGAAGSVSFYRDVLRASGVDLFEGQAHRDIHVFTPGGTRAGTLRRRTASFESAEPSEALESAESAEQVVQQVVEAAEALAPVLLRRTFDTCEPELVVLGLLVGVAQYRVGLRRLLELLLRGLLLRVGTGHPAVRVPFERSLPVCALYLVGTRALAQPEHLVIVSFISHILHCLLLCSKENAELCKAPHPC